MSKKKPHLIILGVGFGGLNVFYYLKKAVKAGLIDITLIDQKNYFLFTPLLHEVATGGIDDSNTTQSIRELISGSPARFVLARVEEINLYNKSIKTTQGSYSYDYLVIALGAKDDFTKIKGAKEYALSIKTLPATIALKNHLIHNLEKAHCLMNADRRGHNADISGKNGEEIKTLLRFVIIGGGATGVELAGELANILQREIKILYPSLNPNLAQVILIHSGECLLPRFHPSLCQKTLQILKKMKIKVYLSTKVIEINKDYIILKTGEQIRTHTAIWAAGIKATEVFTIPTIDKENGRIKTLPTLELPNFPGVFVLGDITYCLDPKTNLPLAQTAQVAVAEAQTAALNIKSLMNQQKTKIFYYHHKGDLISIGQGQALAIVKKIVFTGAIAWLIWRLNYLFNLLNPKDRIHTAIDWFFNLFSPRDLTRLD